ncbi:CBS domain-containing protein, partial [Thermogemmatispora sp.]
HRDLVTVRPEADARSVAEVIAKYNLFAVPVVNDEGLLQGIVTVDDAIDVLLPPERRRRPPRRY